MPSAGRIFGNSSRTDTHPLPPAARIFRNSSRNDTHPLSPNGTTPAACNITQRHHYCRVQQYLRLRWASPRILITSTTVTHNTLHPRVDLLHPRETSKSTVTHSTMYPRVDPPHSRGTSSSTVTTVRCTHGSIHRTHEGHQSLLLPTAPHPPQPASVRHLLHAFAAPHLHCHVSDSNFAWANPIHCYT